MAISYGSTYYFCEDQNEINRKMLHTCKVCWRYLPAPVQNCDNWQQRDVHLGQIPETGSLLVCINSIRLEKEGRERLKEMEKLLQLPTQALPSSHKDTMPHPCYYFICKYKLYFTVSLQ